MSHIILFTRAHTHIHTHIHAQGYNYTYGLPGNPPLPPQYADLGVTLNWDATFPYQSHGVFVPYNLSSGAPFGPGGWTTCFGSYDCPEGQKFISPACAAPPCWQTSYAEINRVYESLRANYGISNCMCECFRAMIRVVRRCCPDLC